MAHIAKKVNIILFFFLGISQITLGNEIDSIQSQIKKLPAQERLTYLTELKYGTVVTHSQELIPLFLRDITVAKKQKKPLLLAKLYEKISLAYYFNGKYDKNFEYGLKAAHLFDSLRHDLKLGIMYGELGYQMKRRDMQKAFELMQKGMQIVEKLQNSEQMAKIYDNYGVLHELNQNIDSALYFYQKSLAIKKQLNDSIGLPYTLCNIYMALMLDEQTDLAISYLNDAFLIRESIDDAMGITECYGYYGDYYKAIGSFIKSNNYYQKALKNAYEFNYSYLIAQLYKKLSENYELINNYKQSLFYYKLYKTYQDSLLNTETNKTIANLQVKYETTEKEKKIQKQKLEIKSKSLQVFTLLIFSILVIVVFLLIYSRYRQKQKLLLQEKLNEEKNLRLIEVIETEEKERTRIARELHDGLGQLLSTAKINLSGLEESIKDEDHYLLENSLQLMDESVNEVRNISHDLMPVSLLRYGLKATIEEMVRQINEAGQIKIECTCPAIHERLPEKTERTIYRLVQEILNNIIRHANASKIQLNIQWQQKNVLFIEIINDGISFDITKLKNSKGIGWKNIFARINMLNGDIKINPQQKGGTHVEILLNL